MEDSFKPIRLLRLHNLKPQNLFYPLIIRRLQMQPSLDNKTYLYKLAKNKSINMTT